MLPIDEVSASVLRLAGRTPDDSDLRAFLVALGAWPLDDFPADEYDVYFKDKARGFTLMFQDARTVKHPMAAGKPSRTPLFVGCYFYTQGKDGYQLFQGALPHGVTWSDTPDTLLARLGPVKNNIVSKKTGALTAQRWLLDGLLLTVGYKNGVIEDVYIGII